MNLKKIERELTRIFRQALLVGDLFGWIWRLLLRRRDDGIVFYLDVPVHYAMFKDIHRYLPQVQIVAGNAKTADSLRAAGVPFTTGRTFPRAVIMADYCKNAFPFPWIRKIQLWHGVGCKKAFYDKAHRKYDLYVASGEETALRLRRRGIRRVAVVGYPKSDRLHDGSYDRTSILHEVGADPRLKTILFAPTWGEISSAPKIPGVVALLGERYNVLVKLHDHTPDEWRDRYRMMPGVTYLEDPDISPYLYASDLIISDFSTVIFEFAQLSRPVISYGVPDEFLRDNAADPAWWEITKRVFDECELKETVESLLREWRQEERDRELLDKIFGIRDGGASVRAARAIQLFLAEGDARRWKRSSSLPEWAGA